VHGQTVAHQVQQPQPAPRGTLQIGVTAALAERLHMPVVGDLRAMDVSLGGQGAPIVPVAHWFFMSANKEAALAVNLGGICNITLVSQDIAQVQGYDVGPGMMLSDAYARLMSGGAITCDKDGAISAQGRLIPALLAELLAHPFVARKAPKSAGREEFGRSYYEPLLQRYHAQHAPSDVMRTLVEGTAHILKRTMDATYNEPKPFARLVLTGGGALNPQMRLAMARAFDPIPVTVADQGVMAPQNHEPAAMALIASRTMHGLPSALPQVTGAPYGSVLGHICKPTPKATRLRPGGLTQRALHARLCGPLKQSLDRVATAMLDAHAVTAVSYAVHQGHRLVHAEALGHAQLYQVNADAPDRVVPLGPQHPGARVTPDHLFDIASLTKVAATTACVMALVSDGRLALHARVGALLPEARGTDKQNITVAELLSHRSGLSAWAPLYLVAPSPAQALSWIIKSPLQHPPGIKRLYSDLGYVVIGALIEAIVGMPLRAYFQERIVVPAGAPPIGYLQDVAVGPHGEARPMVATAHGNGHEQAMLSDAKKNGAFAHHLSPGHLEAAQRLGTQQGAVNDGNAHRVFGGAAAHAGLFATADGVGQLLSRMTCPSHTAPQHEPVFAPEVVDTFLQPVTQDDFLGFANPCTWQSLAPWHHALDAHNALVTEGFTGCFAVVVPSVGVTLTLLGNRQHQAQAHAKTLPQLYPYWAQAVSGLLEQL
jgi:anhydro-N-acetylmuramic acid kinase